MFRDGESRKTVTLYIVNDETPEDDETLELFLNNPTGGLDLGEPIRGEFKQRPFNPFNTKSDVTCAVVYGKCI